MDILWYIIAFTTGVLVKSLFNKTKVVYIYADLPTVKRSSTLDNFELKICKIETNDKGIGYIPEDWHEIISMEIEINKRCRELALLSNSEPPIPLNCKGIPTAYRILDNSTIKVEPKQKVTLTMKYLKKKNE